MPALAPSSVLATLTTHIHTATLLSTYTLLFPSVVATPQSTLTQTLPLLSLVQTVYTLLCLSNPPRYAHPKKGGKKTSAAASIKAKLFALVGANLLPTVLSLVVSLTLGTAVFYGVLILFGAAVTTSFAATVGAAAHIALLVIFPLVCVYGVEGERWREVIALQADCGEAVGGAVGACVGAWLGAVPIPLDWDREWQKWPVTVVTGAYVGYAVGKTAGGLLKGKKMPF